MSAILDNAWADLTLARRVLEDSLRQERDATQTRRRAEAQVEHAEQVWRQALADGREAERP